MRRYKYLPLYLCGAAVLLYTVYLAVFCWDMEYLPGDWIYQSSLREQIDFYAEHGADYENNITVSQCLRFCRMAHVILCLQVLLLLGEPAERIGQRRKFAIGGITALVLAFEFFVVKYLIPDFRLFMVLLPACILAAGGVWLAQAYSKSASLENPVESHLQKGLIGGYIIIFQLICIYGILLNGLQHFLPALSMPYITAEQYNEFFDLYMNQDAFYYKFSVLYERWEGAAVLAAVSLIWLSISQVSDKKHLRRSFIITACCILACVLLFAAAVALQEADRLFILYLRLQAAVAALLLVRLCRTI